jgi:hypothetical protein
MDTLPPLPHQEWLGYDPEQGNLHGYTADQMRSYAAAALAQREPLTDEQINRLDTQAIHGGADSLYAFRFARAIERAHGITKDKP